MAVAFATWSSVGGLRLNAPGTGMPLGALFCPPTPPPGSTDCLLN